MTAKDCTPEKGKEPAEKNRDVDLEKAEALAHDRLVDALRHPTESSQSDVGQLTEHTVAIKAALERGETPEKRDIEQARRYTKQVEERLDEVTALFGWNPWDTGATWGDLTDEQQTEIEERDRQRCEATPTSNDQNGWSSVGRELMSSQLQELGDRLQVAFNRSSSKARNESEELTGDDVDELYNLLQETEIVVDELAKVPDGYERTPRFEDLLSDAEMEEIIQREEVSDEE